MSLQRLVLWMIGLYQSKISSRKGFNCAHHKLHGQETCSNAVKYLVAEHGLIESIPAIRSRFRECREAFNQLSNEASLPTRADLPISCDAPCDVSFGDCGGAPTDSESSCLLPCIFIPGMNFSNKAQNRVFLMFCLASLLIGYWYYGREVSSISIERTSARTGSLITRLFVRDDPKLRVMLQVDGKKYYSNVISLNHADSRYTLPMSDGPESFKIDKIELQDARLSVGGDLFVIGQAIESIDNPKSSGEGERFKFSIKRRWHLY